MASAISRLRAKAPHWLKRMGLRVRTAREFYGDYRAYMRSSLYYLKPKRDALRDDREVLEARLRLSYHALEKGQSMASPRRPYGLQKFDRIEHFLGQAERWGMDLKSAAHATAAMEAARAFNDGGPLSDQVAPVVHEASSPLDPDAISQFMSGRRSIRNFNPDRLVDEATIATAIELASAGTPSVCNRRSYRAHYYRSREQIDSLLALQNGNRGFGHEAPGLLVITTRRSSFTGAKERNQRWVDGGLFAMTVTWALHALGVGTCMLNWSQSNSQTAKLRNRGAIPESEDVIVMIAVGHPRLPYRAAKSPVRPLEETYVCH